MIPPLAPLRSIHRRTAAGWAICLAALFVGPTPGVGQGIDLVNTLDTSLDGFPEGVNSLLRRATSGSAAIRIANGGSKRDVYFGSERLTREQLVEFSRTRQLIADNTFDVAVWGLLGQIAEVSPDSAVFEAFLAQSVRAAAQQAAARGAASDAFTTGAMFGFGVFDSDPYQARTFRLNNPIEETVTFRVETATRTEPMDAFTLEAVERFSAEVFDTGGDPGAELQFNLAHTLRQATSEEEIPVSFGHSGTINAGELSTEEITLGGFVSDVSQPFDRILSSAFLTLTPGDTAEITMIGNFGDENFALTDFADIEFGLRVAEAFLTDALEVPEPAAATLLVAAAALLARPRHRGD